MGFSPAEAILVVLLLAAIATGLLLLRQIHRLRAGHEAFRRALGQSATVLATAEAGVRDLSSHGSQMLLALDQALAEAREIDHSLSYYVNEVKTMPWLPSLATLQQANAQAAMAAMYAPGPPPPSAGYSPAPPPPAMATPQAAPPPRPAAAAPAPFHPAFVSRQPEGPQAGAVVETLADRLKARAVAGQASGWRAR